MRLALKIVMQNDGDFVDIILLYLHYPYVSMLKFGNVNGVITTVFIHVDKSKLTKYILV